MLNAWKSQWVNLQVVDGIVSQDLSGIADRQYEEPLKTDSWAMPGKSAQRGRREARSGTGTL
jgi:hypothetical protein